MDTVTTSDKYLLYCRLCANSLEIEKKISIFETNFNDNESTSLIDIIYNILGIKVLKTDNLPKVICKKCNSMINSIQTFKLKCQQAEKELHRKILQTENIKQCTEVTVKEENDIEEVHEVVIVEIENDYSTDHTNNAINFVSACYRQDSVKIEEYNNPQELNEKHEQRPKDTNKVDPIISKEKWFSNGNESPKAVGRGIRGGGRKPKICEVCGITSKNISDHMHVHSQKRVNCPMCPNTYSRNTALNRHLLTHSDKKFLCEYCELTFSCQTYLAKHIKIHTGERNHICDICNKAFQTRYNLKTHIRIHTKEKPFKCEKCELSFAHRATFNIHTRECKNI